jgi:hypothetical protein
VSWATPPTYDASRKALEWEFRAEVKPTGVLNHTLRLFGRKGFLDGTAVQPDRSSSEAIPLNEVMKNITFNSGRSYQDYQPGDKIAKTKLVELIAGPATETKLGPFIQGAIWGGVVLVAGGIAGIVVVLRRKYKIQKISVEQPTGRDPGLAALFHNGNGSNRNGSRRKKAFNYQKYYSDMMLQVSSGPSSLETMLVTNGKRPVRETNGWHPPQPQPPVEGTAVNQAIMHANLELIANQTNLIEEQKRLLQEQSKLIEEKSRLIREKNQILEKQAELFERDLL